jgi:hypothetical protein
LVLKDRTLCTGCWNAAIHAAGLDHLTRSFTKIDQEQISAQLEDGVLTLTRPKAKDASRGG